jgi:hypothetical protein
MTLIGVILHVKIFAPPPPPPTFFEFKNRNLSIFFRAQFTLQVLRAGLMCVAVSVRGRLFNFNAFLYDYVTVLVFYLITSSSVFIVLTAVGICAAVTFRRWIFVTVSILNAQAAH